MTITSELKENWKEEKVNLRNAISSLKKSMLTYKTERKEEWKSFKKNYKTDKDKIEQSLKRLTILYKK